MRTQDRCNSQESRAIVHPTVSTTRVRAAGLAEVLTQAPGIAFGGRLGNLIDTGSSLPTSGQASNIAEANTRSRIAPRRPSQRTVSDFTQKMPRAASRAREVARAGQAQQAPERAEIDLLSRSARIGGAGGNLLICQIAEARRLLANYNREQEARLIEATESSIAHARH